MEETLRANLLLLSAALEAAAGITPATVGKRALNDNTVFNRLRDASLSFNVRTYDRLVAWIDQNWPASAEWPQDVPRPVAVESAAA